MDREGSERTPRHYLYAEVLRLPVGTKSPDLYTLLGLKFFEPDHGTIVRAAMERIELLEACQADPRPAFASAAEKLTARVREAQLILLDPKRRKRYDQSLIGKDARKKREDPRLKETDLPTGTMVAGRYRVLGERRRGLFGIVYDALDSNLRTRVELSVLRPALSKDKRGARRRSERASRAAALLDHPGIVRVDEVGDADGLLFVRTRAVEGMSLLEIIESTEKMRLEPELARTIGRQIASALGYAHMKETTHGDLRPHNVVLGPEDRVFVGDFCISRVVLDEIKAPAPRTRAYEDEDSPAADVFSLGCLLYQMLGGMPPFSGETKKRAPRPLPDDVPEGLRTLVMHLLDKDPAKRPEARAVAERLAPKTTVRRTPLLVGAAGVLVAIVLGLLFLFGGGGDDGGGSVRERAWELIAERRFDEAIEALQDARALDPEDGTLVRPLTPASSRRTTWRWRSGCSRRPRRSSPTTSVRRSSSASAARRSGGSRPSRSVSPRSPPSRSSRSMPGPPSGSRSRTRTSRSWTARRGSRSNSWTASTRSATR
jgi:serine/threonine protein kinase